MTVLPLSDVLKDDFCGPDFIGLLEDDRGRWQDICCWSGQHREFMPRSCLPDPGPWRADCAQRGTRIVGWWPMPEMPAK